MKPRPRHLLVEALDYTDERGAALDLGAGDLRDSRYLLKTGFQHVTALDKLPLGEFEGEVIEGRIEDVELPKVYFDLVNAQFSLPFMPRDTFAKVQKALKTGGIFVGNMFGHENEQPKYFTSKEELLELLTGFKVLYLAEVFRIHNDFAGVERSWHLYDFIAQKI